MLIPILGRRKLNPLVGGLCNLLEIHKAGVPVQIYLTLKSMPLTIMHNN